MTYIPNDPPYTDEFLRDEDKEFIKGWDLATEEIETYFNNREDGYGDTEITASPTLNKIVNEYNMAIKHELVDWMKMTRQEYIVSLIDGYTDEELKERGYEPGE